MMPVDRDTLIREAVDWAERGIAVFPCKADKAPLTEHGFHDATSDPDKVRALFEFYGDAAQMIGGSMGDGIFAVDVDLYKSDDVKGWLKEKIDDGTLPETRIHETKSGGLHFLYEGDAKDCKPHPGVEIKSDGGYVILPGSPGYKVRSEGIAKAPPALIETIRRAATASRGSSVSQLEANILNGSDFHSSLAQIASKLSVGGATQIEVQQHLITLLDASTAARPGHSRHVRWRTIAEDRGGELSRIVSSAHSKYNDDAIQEEFSEVPDIHDLVVADNQQFFAQPDQVSDDPAETPVLPYNQWPFSGLGYFADEEHNLAEQSFTMYPIFAENETVVLFAAPKTGKTAIALTTALHIACGMDLGSFKVAEGGPCLYYAMEGSRAIKLRIAAWKKHMVDAGVSLPERIPMFTVERQASLYKETARAEAAALIIAADKYSRGLGTPLKAIYIDTLTKAMSGGDQNSVEDTACLFDIVERVRAGGVNATIVFVHHKARAGNVRGSSNIEAESDVLLDVSKQGEIVQLRIAHARSIEDGHTFHFKLSGLELGNTTQGHPLAGVLAIPLSGPAAEAAEIAEVATDIELGQRRKAVVELGDCSSLEVIDKWVELGILKGRNVKGITVPPSEHSAEAQKALRSVSPEPQGTIYGDHVIREKLVEGNLIGFTVGKAAF